MDCMELVSTSFERKAIFRIAAAGKNAEDLELELIDFGLESLEAGDENEMILYCPFTEFGNLQKGIEALKLEVIESSIERLPTTTTKLSAEQQEEVMKLIDRLEEDDDVQNVYHNMDDEE